MAGSPGGAAVYVLELAGEDDPFAVAEARNACEAPAVVAPGIAVSRSVDPARSAGLAFTRRVSRLVAETGATVAEAETALREADIDAMGSVAVRASDVRRTTGVDTVAAERSLGAVLVDRGCTVDLDSPDRILRALFAGDRCLLGWLAVESERGYGRRAPTEKPFFQPGSMDPLLARAVANLAGARRGRTLFDPMCGTGGLLVEAGLLGARVWGLDAQLAMVRGSRRNLAAFLEGGYDVAAGDATRLPCCGAVDAVVLDVPYGRQSKLAVRQGEDLVAATLCEVRRITSRAVVVADRNLHEEALGAGWSVTDRFVKRVHRSLDRHVHVLVGAS